jgi:hypothetical protein
MLIFIKPCYKIRACNISFLNKKQSGDLNPGMMAITNRATLGCFGDKEIRLMIYL